MHVALASSFGVEVSIASLPNTNPNSDDEDYSDHATLEPLRRMVHSWVAKLGRWKIDA